MLLTLLILWALNHYKNEQKAIKKQFADIQQEKSDLEELMSKNDSQHSTEIEEKEMTIKAMDAELQKYKKNKLYINIAAATSAINAAAIMKTFKKKAKGEGGAPSFDEWNELSQLVNEHLPHFIPALQERYPAISPAETEICLLVRLHFSNAQIATLLNRTESAVSKSKERLLEKIFPGTIGGAREFAQKLQVLGKLSEFEVEGEFLGAEEVVATAVIGRDAVLADGIAVFFRGVALVGVPVVLGVFLRETVHIVVTIGLGEDRGSGDGEVFAVTLDDGGVRELLIGFEAIAIDDDGLGTNLELVEGTVHREDRGVEDINAVDLLGRDDSHRPGNGIALNDLTELITAALSELL